MKSENARNLVTCIVPIRNEAGNLQRVLREISEISVINEIILIEGDSDDDTFNIASEIASKMRRTYVYQQSGKGKFNAVLEGISKSSHDFIVIWDGDGTVKKEDVLRIINETPAASLSTGNRIMGNLESNSMRKANFMGNWFFAVLWAPFLGWKIHDLLCGVKVFDKKMLKTIPKWLLKIDPFGDFILIAAAVKQNGTFSITSIPVTYYPRKYGKSNIKRWRSGFRLIFVSLFCFFWLIDKKSRLINLQT